MPTGNKAKYHGSDGPIHTSFNDFYQVDYTPSYAMVYSNNCGAIRERLL
jgi:hypothetical protein